MFACIIVHIFVQVYADVNVQMSIISIFPYMKVSLVAILDADKEGFLRSDKSLIQTIGRVCVQIAPLSPHPHPPTNTHTRIHSHARKCTARSVGHPRQKSSCRHTQFSPERTVVFTNYIDAYMYSCMHIYMFYIPG